LSFRAFVAASTRIEAPLLCPEITLHLADDLDALWGKQQASAAAASAQPPFWSIAWVGGQALARYTLDRAALFEGRSVLDVGSGSGLCAIAAAKAGARRVEASDVDPCARAVIAINARLNGVGLAAVTGDRIGMSSQWDIVVAGDLWYERFLAARVSAWLTAIAREGTLVLLGDCRRAYFPRHSVTALQRYAITTPDTLECATVTDAAVWQLH
jgi:predicted nicotinamide N-methyase